jgi:hypothetical protein
MSISILTDDKIFFRLSGMQRITALVPGLMAAALVGIPHAGIHERLQHTARWWRAAGLLKLSEADEALVALALRAVSVVSIRDLVLVSIAAATHLRGAPAARRYGARR